MASNNSHHTGYAAIKQEPGYAVAGACPPGSENMTRTDSLDSGYGSNHPPTRYYGDPNAVLPEEEMDSYQYEEARSMDWQTSQPYDEGQVDDPVQYSDYIVARTGSQMEEYYYGADSIPRAAARTMMDNAYAVTHTGMDLDDDSGAYYPKDEAVSAYAAGSHYQAGQTWVEQGYQAESPLEAGWPAQLTLTQYPQEAYHDPAHPTGIPPPTPEVEGASPTPPTADTSAPPARSRSTKHSRHRLPASKPPHGASSHLAVPSATVHHASAPVRFPCLVPNCAKQFNRAADLDRHQKFIHCKDTIKPMICDYRRCPRHQSPFHRADHFRDHLREQHKEDLLKRGGSGTTSSTGGSSSSSHHPHHGPGRGSTATDPDELWWRSRLPAALYGGWFRCSKCFARVVVGAGAGADADADAHASSEVKVEAGETAPPTTTTASAGAAWQCGRCQNYCEPERQARRRLPLVCEDVGCLGLDEAARRWHSPAAFRRHLREAHREDVPASEGREGAAELASKEWWESRDPGVAYSSLWRCTRCLDQVESRTHGFECPRCGFGCEETRRSFHGVVEA